MREEHKPQAAGARANELLNVCTPSFRTVHAKLSIELQSAVEIKPQAPAIRFTPLGGHPRLITSTPGSQKVSFSSQLQSTDPTFGCSTHDVTIACTHTSLSRRRTRP